MPRSARERQAGRRVKLGASDAGREAALAHTGRLAGAMEAFDAVAGAAGVIRVPQPRCRVKPSEYLVHAPLPKGTGLGASPSGAARHLLDAAAAHGLRFRRSRQRRAGASKSWSLSARSSAIRRCRLCRAHQPGCLFELHRNSVGRSGHRCVLLQEELPRGSGTERKEANLRAVNAIAARAGKPIAFVTMISHGLTYSRNLRSELPISPPAGDDNPWPRCVRSSRMPKLRGQESRPSLRCKNQNRNWRKFCPELRGAFERSRVEGAAENLRNFRTERSIARSEKEAAALAAKIGFLSSPKP